MTSVSEFFAKNRYVYLDSALSKEECNKLTDYMFGLKDNGKLVQDEQCPLSWSVYGDPVLDSILDRLREPLSKQLGIDLLPAYTYARIYQPGEILKRHVDRPSCEISGTLTLGHDPESEIWPIFFSKDPKDQAGKSVTIEVGDLLMYRGNELNHWRPAYIGRWQVQVFFHYVDANGPNKEWSYDKRSKLGTIKEEPKIMKELNNEIQKVQTWQNNVALMPMSDKTCPAYTYFHSKFKPELMFTKDECKKIIEYANNKYPTKSTVGNESNGKYAPEVRRVEQYGIPLTDKTKWIYDKIVNSVNTANTEYFKYELLGIVHELQLLHYRSDENGFYDWHVDIGEGSAANRKISVSVILSDERDYEGGDLIINSMGNNINTSKETGSIHMFPSYMLHTVTPVTKGDRWVLVIWIHGSQRFK